MIKVLSPILHPEYISPRVAWDRLKRLIWITDQARSMGIHIMAGKGTGKSRLMGRVIAWLDFIRGVAQVIFDPHGLTIDNFLDKLIRLPREIQEKLWRRVVYVDMSGKSGYVVPFPLFFQLGDESLYEISQRYLDVIRKIDPYLQTASIEGWNALWRVGTHVGMVLAAKHYQITEAESMVLNTRIWEEKMRCCASENADIFSSVEYLIHLSNEKESIRTRKLESFLNKVALFSLDPSMKAMFGADQPGIDWKEIERKRQTVLLDFRHEQDVERRRFKMVWAFTYLLDYIKKRGAGRHQPIGLIIDELTSLFSLQALSNELFGAELDELINIIARNYRLWLTIAHQEMFQLTERIYKSLMTMGTQILGVTTDPMSAKMMAELFNTYNPYLVKKYEPIYGSCMGMPVLLNFNTVEFTIDEQLLLKSYAFRDQNRFRFMVRPAPSEGDIQANIRPMTIERFDKGRYPHRVFVPLARRLLSERTGVKIQVILEEIRKRSPAGYTPLLHAKTSDTGEIEKKDIPIWD